MRKLVVDGATGEVVNAIVVGDLPYQPPAGTTLIDPPPGISIGWRWDGTQWRPPAPAQAEG
jgi:hypothetical protein